MCVVLGTYRDWEDYEGVWRRLRYLLQAQQQVVGWLQEREDRATGRAGQVSEQVAGELPEDVDGLDAADRGGEGGDDPSYIHGVPCDMLAFNSGVFH